MNFSLRTFLGLALLAFSTVFLSCKKEEDNSVYDIDGNHYQTVTIGKQTWMSENLRTTRFNDGSSISNITDQREWAFTENPGYCSYNNDDSNITKYGLLYNWQAVRTGKLAPKGWHIPTEEEWQTLVDYLIANGYNYDGSTTGNKIAKSLVAPNEWELSTFEGTPGSKDYPEYVNKSGFSALPSGCRSWTFDAIGYCCYWWITTKNNPDLAQRIDIYHIDFQTFKNQAALYQGFSVRCIKD